MEKLFQHPVSKVYWCHRDDLQANDYNPNQVAPPERELLRTSIKADRWCSPIVVCQEGFDTIHVEVATPNKGKALKEMTMYDLPPSAYIVRPQKGKKFTIIDGFHRWGESAHPEIYSLTDGFVPIVLLRGKSAEARMASTIRFNRARGTHGVLPMAEIVRKMADAKMPVAQIMQVLGMEKEEVIRLANRVGIPKSDLIMGKGFSEAWGV